MKVAISLRMDQKHGDDRSILEEAYNKYLQQFGIDLLLVPNTLSNVRDYLDKFNVEGIIISGGNDVNPDEYGGSVEDLSLAPFRDSTEDAMLNYAVQKDLPILGICRGMQRLNVHYQGKLVDFKKEGISHPAGREHSHTVSIIDYAHQLDQEAMINSYHNQGITLDTLSSSLKPFAVSGDIVEGLYHPDLPIAGVQWHPERQSPNEAFNAKILRAFVGGELFWKK
mgnify:CR=1 FL=1